MRLDRNSWHVRLNRFVYGQDVRLNPNICPYFWKTVVALPLALLAVVGTLVRSAVHSYQAKSGVASPNQLAFQKVDHWEERVIKDSNLEVGFYSSAVLVVGALALFIVGFLLYTLITAPMSILFALGVLAVVGLILGVWHSADLWWPMVYSAYQGVCPSVEWYDSDEVVEPEEVPEVDETDVDPEADDASDDTTDETGEE